MMNRKLAIAWTYLSELVLATLSIVVLLFFFKASDISNFVRSIAADSATISGAMVATAIAFLWTFYSKSDTPFSQWLYERGAYNTYLSAYIFALVIYSLLTVLLILSSKINNVILVFVTLWFLMFGIVNIHTFFKNIIDQLKLNMEFNRSAKNDDDKG